MKSLKSVLMAVVLGIIITLATGAVSSTPGGLVGGAWYGYPQAWIVKRVLGPQYTLMQSLSVRPTGFIIDLIFWIVIAAVIVLIVSYATKGNKKGKSKK